MPVTQAELMAGFTSDLPSPTNAQAVAAASSQQLATGTGYIISATWAETAGAVALQYLRDGIDSTGELLACIGLTANAGGGIDPGLPGLLFRDGIYLHRVSGTISLVVWWIPLWYAQPQ